VRHRPWTGAGATVPVVLGALLISSAPAEAKFGDNPLAKGDRGRDVRVLQRWLGLVGFETEIDGHFGRETRTTLRAYERSNDERVDGRLSRSEAKRLRKRAVAAFAAGSRDAASPRSAAGDTGAAAEATLNDDGTATAPADAPQEVKDAIAAANRLIDKPYKYGGGHGRFEDSGYDCSGAVSYALHGAGKLEAPLDSSGLERYGEAGEGEWITVYAHGSHAYVVIAGLRFDTSGEGEKGPRWRSQKRGTAGYTVRHPEGL
jgi:peptidoglycan hydrolase-like protein with peptidoglycan-binding domain